MAARSRNVHHRFATGRGLGLIGMRERAQALGGTFPVNDREREVIQLIAEGKTNKDIAAIIFISPSTVETHRARIMEKLDVHAPLRSSSTPSGVV
jgi:DNA-binding CsgD family transcriptional regulator